MLRDMQLGGRSALKAVLWAGGVAIGVLATIFLVYYVSAGLTWIDP